MKVNVVYKTYLNKQSKKDGRYFKRIVKVCTADENEHLQVALLRQLNKNPNARYSLGHVKEEEVFKTACCEKSVHVEEAILNHGMCDECMDKGSK